MALYVTLLMEKGNNGMRVGKPTAKLWTCQRYGMFLGTNSNHKNFIKNIKTNEIVWRSWEDENPYRMGI